MVAKVFLFFGGGGGWGERGSMSGPGNVLGFYFAPFVMPDTFTVEYWGLHLEI